MGFTRLEDGDVGIGGLANLLKLIHCPEFELSDSSHSMIVVGVMLGHLVGLEGADSARNG